MFVKVLRSDADHDSAGNQKFADPDETGDATVFEFPGDLRREGITVSEGD